MNNDENLNQLDEESEEPENKSLKYFYIALGCFAVGLILFVLSIALSLTVMLGGGVYMVVASMISELAAVAFLNAQKRIYYNKACFILKIASYVVMGVGLAFILIGMSLNIAIKN